MVQFVDPMFFNLDPLNYTSQHPMHPHIAGYFDQIIHFGAQLIQALDTWLEDSALIVQYFLTRQHGTRIDDGCWHHCKESMDIHGRSLINLCWTIQTSLGERITIWPVANLRGWQTPVALPTGRISFQLYRNALNTDIIRRYQLYQLNSNDIYIILGPSNLGLTKQF